MSVTQLWVGNTNVWQNEEQLMETILQKTGVNARSCWFQRNKLTGELSGYGFIDFNSASDAATVLRLLKDTPIPHDHSFSFKLNWGKNESDLETIQQASGYSVYVGNLPLAVDESKLLSYFRRYFPEVINARIVNGTDGVSKGYGFVKFNTQREVNEAIKALNGSAEFGRPIKVSEASGNRIHTETTGTDLTNTTLFVSDLDPEIVKEEKLLFYFRQYGNVVRIKFVNGHPDWAYVTMETRTEAESARNALQGTRFGGTQKAIIQFGRAIEEAMPAKSVQSVTIPRIKPPKISAKVRAQYFDGAGTERVIDIMNQFSRSQRPFPLNLSAAKTANAMYENRAFAQSMLLDWNCSEGDVTANSRFWYF